jgi:hypothetical protein
MDNDTPKASHLAPMVVCGQGYKGRALASYMSQWISLRGAEYCGISISVWRSHLESLSGGRKIIQAPTFRNETGLCLHASIYTVHLVRTFKSRRPHRLTRQVT